MPDLHEVHGVLLVMPRHPAERPQQATKDKTRTTSLYSGTAAATSTSPQKAKGLVACLFFGFSHARKSSARRRSSSPFNAVPTLFRLWGMPITTKKRVVILVEV